MSYEDLLEQSARAFTSCPALPEARSIPLGADRSPRSGSDDPAQPPVPRPPLRPPLPRLGGAGCATGPRAVFAQQLDRTKPLWELWMVQGLTRKRSPSSPRHITPRRRLRGSTSQPSCSTSPVPSRPSPGRLVPGPDAVGRAAARQGRRGPSRALGHLLRRIEQVVEHPRTAVGQVSEAAEALGQVGWDFFYPAPQVPLNVEIGSPPVRGVRADLARFKRIKSSSAEPSTTSCSPSSPERCGAGCTRGVRTEGVELRVQVPVSIRAEDERGHLGNKLAVLRGSIPVYVEDPVKRLEICRRGMEGIKRPSRPSAPR